MSSFGGLMLGCISDEYTRHEKGTFWESVLFLALGVCTSVVTTYLLSLAGILL